MKARTLAATLFGVGGVWMLALTLSAAGGVLDVFLEHGDSPDMFTPGLWTMLGVQVTTGIALLLGRNRLATWLFEEGEVDLPAETALLDVGFRLAGVFTLARGLESLAWHLTAHRDLEQIGNGWTFLAKGAVLVVFGLGLLLGARTLVGLLQRARQAGHASPGS